MGSARLSARLLGGAGRAGLDRRAGRGFARPDALPLMVPRPMFDALSPPPMQRSHGEAAVRLTGGRLADLRQRGSAKALLPRVPGPTEIVFLNTSGGLTSGDRLDYRVTLGPGDRAIATTQTAERAYRAEAGPACVSVTHQVGAGGWLDWLPQETILFDRADLDRQTTLSLGPGAGALMVESIVLGRVAMGETPRALHLRDRRRIERGGRPIWIDPLHLSPGVIAEAAEPALLGGARALATLILCAPGAEDALGPLRAALSHPGVQGAASAFDGKLIVRLLADDAWPLRQQTLACLHVLRRGAPPPRVWQM